MSVSVNEVRVARLAGEATREDRDPVVVEAPLEIRIDGKAATVVMRTPGNDDELAQGLLYAEGLIGGARDVRALRRPPPERPEEDGNVLDVVLAPSLVRRRVPERSMISTSACGVCGKTSIAALEVRAAVVDSELTMARAAITRLPERLRAAQAVFAETGGLHGAGAFTGAGELLCLREDVGRHNAVDKVVGWALGAGKLPAGDLVLCVSGRLGFEIVQKAVVAGFPIVAAVSAPSSLAIELALRFGVTLCGFVRGDGFNVYARPDRIR